MSATIRMLTSGAALAALSVFSATDLAAQCSRGGDTGTRSAPLNGATSPINVMARPSLSSMFAIRSASRYRSASDPSAQSLALQNQLRMQQQAYAMRQQMMRQNTQRQHEQRQAALSIRRERAAETRQRRADRIARAKAKRESEQLAREHSSSPSSLVTAPSQPGALASLTR